MEKCQIFNVLKNRCFYSLECTVAHNCHGKTKNLTAKPKQIATAKPKLFCFRCEEFGFAVRYFGFAVTGRACQLHCKIRLVKMTILNGCN